jgi:hypothetical protein
MNQKPRSYLLSGALILLLAAAPAIDAADWTVYDGGSGPGNGKHIVLISGDEEYRSEEAMPMLARILAVRHGFKSTVLFPINPQTGLIDPICQTNIPGLHLLNQADMMVLFLRFRELPDDQMTHFVDFVNSGKPILGIRTATHAFSYDRNKQSPFARYDWRDKEWPGGFGQQVLGETWINHHGDHNKESTRGIVNPRFQDHPILRGVTDIWGPTDVYGVVNLPANAKVLLLGQVLTGMKPTDPPLPGKKNEPMMPLVWLREYRGATGKTSRIITSTFGSAVDFQSEDSRRLIVNACYWALGLEEKIPAKANVDYVGTYEPTYFGFGKFKPNLKPDHYAE